MLPFSLTVLITLSAVAQTSTPGNQAAEPFRIADNLMRANPRGANPFVDSQGYRAYIDRAEKRFRDQLAREKGR